MKNRHCELFVNYLSILKGIVEKIENATNSNPQILFTRLTEDMLPLYTQVEIAASFSLRSCCPIANTEVVSFTSENKTFEGLKTQLEQTLNHIKALDTQAHDLDTLIDDMAGPVSVQLPAGEFLDKFAFPNFYFHISMVYAIARANKIPLSKGDFDGIHQYPVGFSFEN